MKIATFTMAVAHLYEKDKDLEHILKSFLEKQQLKGILRIEIQREGSSIEVGDGISEKETN